MSLTESESIYHNLEHLNALEIINGINHEDQKVAISIQNEMISISNLIEKVFEKLKQGGRLFYLGAGTSGRLGIVDASECPPTFGVSADMVIGIIAGGMSAMFKAVEFAEDDTKQGWVDLQAYQISEKDFVIGISASGRTPYVLGALQSSNNFGIETGCIVCNKNSIIAQNSKYPIEVELGPEFITGSTRMKSGTAQKLILNMISTTCMILLGKVKGNKMIDMQLTNHKLIDRGTKMIMDFKKIDYNAAKELLLKHGSVRKAIEI